MRSCRLSGAWVMLVVLASTSALDARVWVLPIERRNGSGWVEETTGGHDGNGYWWAANKDGERRAWWKFEAPFAADSPSQDNPPGNPRPYLVEVWIEPLHCNVYSPIEVELHSQINPDYFPWEPETPWAGAWGTNHQWLNRWAQETQQPGWVMAGPGPQAPESYDCSEDFGNGPFVWMQRGTELYVKWDFSWYDASSQVAVAAVRITELEEPLRSCTSTSDGPVDLHCIGNADPLYGAGEPFGNNVDTMVRRGDSTLAVEGYFFPCVDRMSQKSNWQWSTAPFALTPGLPVDGSYTVVLPDDSVPFQLRYDPFSAIKWRTGDTEGAFSRYNVFTLNGVAEQEFAERSYGRLHLLSVKSDGSNGELVAEAIYSDASSDVQIFKLYDWFGTDGDTTSQAVGVDGELRSGGEGVNGFKRVKHRPDAPPNWNSTAGGGDHGGAFLFYHSMEVNKAKILKQVRLSIQADERGLGGSISVVGVRLDKGVPCAEPVVFDVVGGTPDITGLASDGSVDHEDFGVFQQCITAAPGAFPHESCVCFDINQDQRVDSEDYTYFEACATGPKVPIADPDCDEPVVP